MSQISDFFSGLFDTALWPARWHCGYWSDFHGWMYIISDLLIWLAYFLIPVIILDYFIKKKKTIKFQRVYLLFASFILLCGATHFLDAMAFWIPMYRLNAFVRLLTAIISLLTAFYLIRLLPKVFKQQTNLELEMEILKRKTAEHNLKNANADLEAFAYVASHDLQEPLRKILVYSSMLFRDNENTDEKSKNLITKISSSADRLKKMTAGILNLSVLKGDVEMTLTPLSDAIGLALSDLEQPIAEKSARINMGRLPSVYGNPSYLYQLFLNLIGNALKFSAQEPIITITAEERNDFYIIRVSDNGIGIKPEGREKIFNAFERLGAGSGYEGSGIGLAICKRIVEIHQGRISVESTPGAGSVFIIEIPAQMTNEHRKTQ